MFICKFSNNSFPVYKGFLHSKFLTSIDKNVSLEDPIEFFLNNTNLTFPAFLYKIYIKGFKISRKVASSETQTYNTNHLWITRQSYHSATQTCVEQKIQTEFGSFVDSIEHDFLRVRKSETGNNWQISWVGKAE